jgi:hypothetical protein
LANFSPNSLSLSLSPWTSRKPSPSDHFSISLQINNLRLDSGEWFFAMLAYAAGCERLRRERNQIVVDRNAQCRNYGGS